MSDQNRPLPQHWEVRLRRSFERAATRMRNLPELVRVFVMAALVLAGIFLPILALVYRAEIWRTVVLLGLNILGLMVALGVALGIRRLVRIRRRRALEHRAVQPPPTARPSMQAALAGRDAVLQAVAEGHVTPLTEPVALLLRSSEVLWHRCEAWLRDAEDETHAGELFVTSLRVFFVSVAAPVEIPIADLNAVKYDAGDLQLIGRTASGSYVFMVDDPELVAAFVSHSVRAAHHGAAARQD